jgi:hypothetical protein
MTKEYTIPEQLECEYCERNKTHGGECQIVKKETPDGCVAFKEDERGCIKQSSAWLSIPLYHNMPPVGIWMENRYDGFEHLRITQIKGIDWDQDNLKLACEFDYFEPFIKKEEKEEPVENLQVQTQYAVMTGREIIAEVLS